MPVALKRFAAALRVLSFGMSWCYLDTRLKGITFLVLSAREICGGDLGRASEGDRAITLVSRNPRL
ncbi:hypothetical protein [Tychonema sp. LEGE 06208]|uniref:hypothetical protein n=1 Tax=Tychonema sp. LEGE 06208 TaxID=1828663 RepID=UPI00188129C7|nr:hypothetical protein [Tychonema sp. LEGE 06208]MBE9161381.1 hypothetical protein [Tychonema sp. LEGE 06208]